MLQPHNSYGCSWKIIAENPDCRESLAIAISKAVEQRPKDEDSMYPSVAC